MNIGNYAHRCMHCTTVYGLEPYATIIAMSYTSNPSNRTKNLIPIYLNSSLNAFLKKGRDTAMKYLKFES